MMSTAITNAPAPGRRKKPTRPGVGIATGRIIQALRPLSSVAGRRSCHRAWSHLFRLFHTVRAELVEAPAVALAPFDRLRANGLVRAFTPTKTRFHASWRVHRPMTPQNNGSGQSVPCPGHDLVHEFQHLVVLLLVRRVHARDV